MIVNIVKILFIININNNDDDDDDDNNTDDDGNMMTVLNISKQHPPSQAVSGR